MNTALVVVALGIHNIRFCVLNLIWYLRQSFASPIYTKVWISAGHVPIMCGSLQGVKK